jgi:Right handed beta helix region
MSRTQSIAIAFVLAAVVGITTTAHAAPRTFVASFGADTNTASNCSLAAPCRGFAVAQTVTDNNGEIIVLDSAGYGAITITKSISIIAPTGVYAGIAVLPGANGVTIATIGVNVVLRGLSINGQGGNNGISMTAGNRLTVENCVIANLTQSGIIVDTAAIVRVSHTIIRDNGSGGIRLENGAKGTITRAAVSGHANLPGIVVFGNVTSSTITNTTADIADSTIDGNYSGVYALSDNATALVRVSVHDSRILRNLSYGLIALSTVGAEVNFSASNNIVTKNSIGIGALNAGTKVWASGNTVSDNSTLGFENIAAVFETAGNNAVRNNGANSGIITIVAAQ